MKKKVKKWFSCITVAALVMSTVNLPIDVLASDFEDGVETSVEDEQMDFQIWKIQRTWKSKMFQKMY